MGVLVSINCITYNHEDYISDALEGFLMQKTDFEFEIIIGEDCSTDNTKKIVEGYVEKYPEKIRLITSAENVGWRKNEERLLEESKGKYIAICEGDDYWIDPYKLQKQVDYMETHPDCTLCFHAAKVVQGNKIINGGRPYTESRICSMEDLIMYGDICPTASFFIPKRLVESQPDFYKEAHVGDYPMQMWLGSEGYAYYIDEVMSVYRTGVKGSWTSKLLTGENIKEKQIKAKLADIKLLQDFNKYSNNNYIREVDKAITKTEFEILLLQNKTMELKKSKYKTLYQKLSLPVKIRYKLKYYFPKLYSQYIKLINLKRSY